VISELFVITDSVGLAPFCNIYRGWTAFTIMGPDCELHVFFSVCPVW